jgi:CheY-like chemotaxis protein
MNEVDDDRSDINPGDRILLIVDNDLTFAQLMLETAREQGFKGIVTSLGAAALALTREYQPQAITLDISLPDIDGWRVLEHLKNNLSTRHIPVVIVSTVDEPERGLDRGAFGVLPKPIHSRDHIENALQRIARFLDHPRKRLLLAASELSQREELRELLSDDDVDVFTTTTAEGTLRAIEAQTPDCVVLDLNFEDLSPQEFVREISQASTLVACPFIVYASENQEGNAALIRGLSQHVTVRLVRSPEWLVDQAALNLHRVVSRISEGQRKVIEGLHRPDTVLAGRKVLIVDDDIRNIFALASVLERQNMQILSAETGRDAIRCLQAEDDIDIVLMDIMMPEMDGIDTMKAIRRLPQFKSLPIIAVTAKAMKGDREKCIEAGAWDYLSKPVDTELLLAVLRAWLAPVPVLN